MINLLKTARKFTEDKARFLVLSIANLFIFYGLIIFLGILQQKSILSADQVIVWSTMLVSVQVGQTSRIQTSVAGYSGTSFFTLALLASVAVSFITLTEYSFLGIALLGSVAGFLHTDINLHNYKKSTLAEFQANLLSRNIILSILSGLLIISTSLAIAIVFAIVSAMLIFQVKTKGHSSNSSWSVFLVSLMAPLLYRNDMNLFRTFFASEETFGMINTALACYGLINAAYGFLITYFVFPADDIARDAINSQRLKRIAYLGVVGSSTLCILAVTQGSILLAIFLMTLVASVTQFYSSVLHLKSCSTAVYVMGVVGFLSVWLILNTGALTPHHALVWYCMGLQFGLFLCYWWFIGRRLA